MAITPMLVDQIEKFQCLELSTAPKLSPGTLSDPTWHVSRVQKRDLKLVNFISE